MGAVALITLGDILAILSVPILQKLFYQDVIKFLIALAIGSLTGDALLHLIPHALSESHQQKLECELLFKALDSKVTPGKLDYHFWNPLS